MKISSTGYELQFLYIYTCMAELLKAKHTNTRVSKQYIKFMPT